MRTFRNAALAGASALALTFGGTAAATAQETPEQDSSVSSSQENNGSSSGSSDSSWQTRFGHLLGNDHDAQVTGQDLWGKERAEDNPEVFEVLRGLSITLGVFAGLTFLIAPAYNFVKFGPFA